MMTAHCQELSPGSANCAAVNVVLVLHAHLPYVRHSEPGIPEEDWFFEGVTECYLPILRILEGWKRDGVNARLTVSLSPTLLEMITDPVLLDRYAQRLHALESFARTRIRFSDGLIRDTWQLYIDRLQLSRQDLDRYNRDLPGAFRKLAEAGVVELITTAASHAFLPNHSKPYQRVQIEAGLAVFHRVIGWAPSGFWLPECGYSPSLDDILIKSGIKYIFIDAHTANLATPAPEYSTLLPIVCESGLVAFPRDADLSAKVWSSDLGYPGDSRYREFHRDFGYDASRDDLCSAGLPPTRKPLGFKLHRVTGKEVPLAEKQPYRHDDALAAVQGHAHDFIRAVNSRALTASSILGRGVVITTPFDAELFGHWWFEGPSFIDKVGRLVCASPDKMQLSTASEVERNIGPLQVARLPASSWGYGGFSITWLNPKNVWMWSELKQVDAAMVEISCMDAPSGSVEHRAITQLSREALLCGASDWPFMISAGSSEEYAERRFREHLRDFHQLLDALRQGSVNESLLADHETKYPIFADMDYSLRPQPRTTP